MYCICLQRVSLHPFYCDLNVLTMIDENHKKSMFPVLPVNVLDLFSLFYLMVIYKGQMGFEY